MQKRKFLVKPYNCGTKSSKKMHTQTLCFRSKIRQLWVFEVLK